VLLLQVEQMAARRGVYAAFASVLVRSLLSIDSLGLTGSHLTTGPPVHR